MRHQHLDCDNQRQVLDRQHRTLGRLHRPLNRQHRAYINRQMAITTNGNRSATRDTIGRQAGPQNDGAVILRHPHRRRTGLYRHSHIDIALGLGLNQRHLIRHRPLHRHRHHHQRYEVFSEIMFFCLKKKHHLFFQKFAIKSQLTVSLQIHDEKPYFLDPVREQERLEKLQLSRAKKIAEKKVKKEKKEKKAKRSKREKEKQKPRQPPEAPPLTRAEKRRIRFEKYREQKALERKAAAAAPGAPANPNVNKNNQPRPNAPAAAAAAKKKPQPIPVAPPPPRWSQPEQPTRPPYEPANGQNYNHHHNNNPHHYQQPQIIVVPVNKIEPKIYEFHAC